MLKQGSDYAREREKALAEGMRDVASELRLVDPADFIAFIRTEQFGNIRTLVNSSTEMFFKPGTICFGLSGEVELPWGCCAVHLARHGVPPHERVRPISG